MIPHYRNTAIKRLALSFLFMVLTVALCGTRVHGMSGAFVVTLGITLSTFALVFYFQGNLALAKAKGHDGSGVAAIVIVAAVCFGPLILFTPFILLFGFKDRTKHRRHSRETELEPTKRNPPAKLPPLRDDRAA